MIRDTREAILSFKLGENPRLAMNREKNGRKFATQIKMKHIRRQSLPWVAT